MKKKILAVMLSAVLAATMLVGCGDSVETGGRAETGETEIQDTDDESQTENGEPNEIIRLVQGIQYNSDGSIFAHEEWEYNADGELVKDTVYRLDGSISGGTMVEYERNAAGDVTKAVSYGLSDGNIREWYEIEYDASGHEVKYTEYTSDGSISGWYEIEYDTVGNRTKLTMYTSDGSISEWYEWEYDASGHEVKYTEYNSSGNVRIRYSKEYDIDGHEIKRTYYSPTGSIIGWYEREYDSDNCSVQYNLYGSLHAENENGGNADYRWQYLGLDDGFEVKASAITSSFSPDDVSIAQELVQQSQESEISDEYWNIVLFGIDNVDEKYLDKVSMSKTCVIISINTDTQEVNLVNIPPDTYLDIGENSYNKAMKAYYRGGAQQAIKMLNRNLDMNLTDFISIGLPTWIQLIDELGGVLVDVDDDLLRILNGWLDIESFSNITKERPNDFYIETTGYQQLNGVQVAAWIYAGQHESLKLNSTIFELMQNTDSEILNQLINDIYTNLTREEFDTFCDILGNNGKYSVIDIVDFPQATLAQQVDMGGKPSCLVPMDLEANVIWLHQFLFGQNDYEVSDTVKEISAQISEDASKYMKAYE